MKPPVSGVKDILLVEICGYPVMRQAPTAIFYCHNEGARLGSLT